MTSDMYARVAWSLLNQVVGSTIVIDVLIPLLSTALGGLAAGAFAIFGVWVGQKGARNLRLDDLRERHRVEQREAVLSLMTPISAFMGKAEIESVLMSRASLDDLMYDWVNQDSAIELRQLRADIDVGFIRCNLSLRDPQLQKAVGALATHHHKTGVLNVALSKGAGSEQRSPGPSTRKLIADHYAGYSPLLRDTYAAARKTLDINELDS